VWSALYVPHRRKPLRDLRIAAKLLCRLASGRRTVPGSAQGRRDFAVGTGRIGVNSAESTTDGQSLETIAKVRLFLRWQKGQRFVVCKMNTLWYNACMTEFGTGTTLREACPWLRNDRERRERILEVTERNSVIEGLPPFREETRRRLIEQLKTMTASSTHPAPAE